MSAGIGFSQRRYSQPLDRHQYGRMNYLAKEDEFFSNSDFSHLKKQRASSSFEDIMILSSSADDLDDREMILWAAVENASAGVDGIMETELTSSIWSKIEARMGLNSNSPSQFDDYQRQHQQQQPTSQPPPLPLSPPPSSPAGDDAPENFHFDRQRSNSEAVSQRGRWAPDVPQQRSQSVDPSASRTTATNGGQRWKRASSESRDDESAPKFSILSPEHQKVEQSEHNASSRPTDGATASVRDPIMERITKSREFWSARSLSVPGQQPPAPGTSAGHHSSSNGRPSQIPRIALPLRTPVMQRSVSEYGGPKAGWIPAASTAMPVIRSTPSPHLSPRSSWTEVDDDKKNKSFIPRPINDGRTSGSDGESVEQQTSAKQTVILGRPHRETSKIYTTVMGPNRYVTSKFSHLSGSSLIPLSVHVSVVDSKVNPTSASSSFATATTQQTQRPVVSSTAIGSGVPQLPSSRA